MAINNAIKTILIRLVSIFYCNKKSKAIFYHDIHFKKQYTDMSTPIGMFKKHIQIIRDNGYEIVAEITKPKEQIEISFDDGFLGLYNNIHLIKLNYSLYMRDTRRLIHEYMYAGKSLG